MNLTKHWAAVIDDYVIDLAWSPDGALLAAASTGGPISIFKPAPPPAANTFLHELPGHDGGCNCIAWMPPPMASASAGSASPALASGGQDGKVKFWDAAAGQHIATADLGSAWVEHIAWRPPARPADGENKTAPTPILAAAAGRDLVFINADASIRHRFAPAAKTISAIVWQPASGALAAAHFGGVQLWDADDFILQKEFPYANGIHALVWSPDNRWLVSGNQDRSVHLWLPETGVELHMSGYESKVTTLAFDRASRWLATGGGQSACVWNCSGASGPEGREPDQLPHEAKVCALAFQHAGGLLATAAEDGSVILWNLEKSSPRVAVVRMPTPATKLAWSPNDKLLAIGTEQGALYVLECQN